MSLTVLQVKDRTQALVAPEDDASFCRLLTEADHRLLESGRWHWTRSPLVLTPDADSFVDLPSTHQSIVACRVGPVPRGVVWQETEFLEDGPGEIPIGGCHSRLVDQGLVDPDETGTKFRRFKVVGPAVEDITVLAKFAPNATYVGDEDETVLCSSVAALKQMMLAIIYEETNDAKRFMEYKALALNELKDNEASYRGIAKEVYKPLLSLPLRRRSRTSFP